MTMTPRLELRQAQALTMAPRMQQALKMLRMSNLELAEHVAGIVEGNPLLAAAAPAGRERPPPPRPGRIAAEGPAALDFAVAPVTLADHLRAQVRLARAGRAEVAAALVLIDELDEDGYLRVPLAEAAGRHGFGAATAERALALVQACEPAGVGARSLGECLRIQLADRGLLDPAMAALVDGLPLLAAGRRGELARLCGVAPEEIDRLLAVLRRCDPKPGAGFGSEAVPVVVPDVSVWRSHTGWRVELNTETLPRILVDNAYAAEIAGSDRRVKAYVSECRMQAHWLVRSLEQRARTILAVTTAIVAHQDRFFAQGVRGLKPLSQRALAERLGLHESTISRVTASKYLECDRGTFPLRHFFSQAIGTTDGDTVSAALVQDRIRSVIEAEPAARTLSDDRIVAILRAEGIDIARRTVAKYREGMGIPSSVERRRLKAPAHA
jgi:RNA polymerase sigma-54 factor